MIWIPDDFADEQTVVCVDYHGVLFADGRLIPLKDYILIYDPDPTPP